MASDQTNMPLPLSEVYKYLETEVMRLHALWMDYRDLFLTSKERIALLNRTASSFFGECQRILLHNIFLAIARLTDPLKSAGKENLTVHRIPLLLPSDVPAGLLQDIHAALDTLDSQVRPIREWRSRKLAHNDLAVSLQFSKEPLPGVTTQAVDEILATVGACLNLLYSHFDKTTCLYSLISRQGGADRLVHHLENGLKWQEEYFKRKLQGTA